MTRPGKGSTAKVRFEPRSALLFSTGVSVSVRCVQADLQVSVRCVQADLQVSVRCVLADLQVSVGCVLADLQVSVVCVLGCVLLAGVSGMCTG